jgi:hypothetical protein
LSQYLDDRQRLRSGERGRRTTRSEAAKIGGVTLQIVRDWVVKFNARGPEGLIDRKAPSLVCFPMLLFSLHIFAHFSHFLHEGR